MIHFFIFYFLFLLHQRPPLPFHALVAAASSFFFFCFFIFSSSPCLLSRPSPSPPRNRGGPQVSAGENYPARKTGARTGDARGAAEVAADK